MEQKENLLTSLMFKTVSRCFSFLVIIGYFALVHFSIYVLAIFAILFLYALICIIVLLVYIKLKKRNKKMLYIFCFPIMSFKTAIAIINDNNSAFKNNDALRFSLVKDWLVNTIVTIVFIVLTLFIRKFDKNTLINLALSTSILIGMTVYMIITVIKIKDKTKSNIQFNFDGSNKVILFIDENYGILTYKEINKKYQLSITDLNKIILENKGVSFKQYSLNLKMNRAKELFNANYKTSEVSKMCGYSSKSSFLKAYKKFFERTN